MIATAMKYVARDRAHLAAFVVKAYGRARAEFLPDIPSIDGPPSYPTLTRMLDAIATVANDGQKHAIKKLVAYQATLEALYPRS